MSEPLSEATGFAHAFSTWIAQGNGLDTKRDGVFRYKAGPMKGMTRDQALMLFQNKIWPNASPEWKDEYSRRGSTGMLAPNEQSDLEKRKASAAGVTQPQYRQQMPQPTTDNGQVALLPAVYGDYGNRSDGTPKGKGWLGELKLSNGNVATEYTAQSQSVKVNGKQIDFPTLVPSLTKEEVQLMVNDIIPNKKPIPDSIMQKAVDHARTRIDTGKSVFADAPAQPSPTPAAAPSPTPQGDKVVYLTDSQGNIGRDSRTGEVSKPFNLKDIEQGSPARQGAQTAMETPVTGFKPLQGQAGVIGLDGKPIPMTGTAPAPTAVSPPQFEANKAAAQQRNATSVAKTAQAIQGKAPSNTPAGKFDMMTADYSTLTREQKDQRTQANVDKAKAKATSMGIPEAMPAMTVTAPRMKPLETKYDMAQGRVVKIGGDADEAYTAYDKAQNAARAGNATAQQRQTVVDYVSQDVLGRQPGQIAKQREDERKGYYEAGRYRGPAATAPTPVSNPVFTGNSSRPKTAPIKSPRQIGRQMGNRAAGMTI